MKHPPVPLLLALSLTLLLAPCRGAHAQQGYVEGDWVAWTDSRDIRDFHDGRKLLYVATSGGVLRYDKLGQRWLAPWVSVPGNFDHAYLLLDAKEVKEDPLTLDVYVLLPDGWVRRNIASERWEALEQLPPEAAARLAGQSTGTADPPGEMIAPYRYTVTGEGSLEYRSLQWPFSRSAENDRGTFYYAWEGFGLGMAAEYDAHLELFPGGPRGAVGFDLTRQEIWCGSLLDREQGWLWHRARTGDRWQFQHPNVAWGLEPGRINELRIGEDGTVWLATENGLMYGTRDDWRHLRRSDGLPTTEVRDVQPVPGGAWIATRFGLAFVQREQGAVLLPDPERKGPASTVAFRHLAARGDTVFAAGAGWLLAWTPEGTWVELKGAPSVGMAAEPNALWAGREGIAVGDRQGLAWRLNGQPWQEVRSTRWRRGIPYAVEWHGGYWWIGTDRGLMKFDPAEGDAVRYTAEEGLVGQIVYEIYGEGDFLWLGTDAGVVRFRWRSERRLD